MKANFLVVLLGSLLAPIVASPTPHSLQETPSSNTTLSERGIPAWQFYYNVNAAQQQTNFNKWSGAGYRPISLSVYGQPPNHLYAAVWVQRSGPSYYAIHDATPAQYQSFFNTHAANGYVSTMITVTGPSNAPIFAGVMEKNGVTNWSQKCGLSYHDFASTIDGQTYIIKSFTEYGSPSNRLFCAIYYPNDQKVVYENFIHATDSEYQQTFNFMTQGPGSVFRPSYFAISEDHLISPEFDNTNVGSWFSRHAMTAGDLQAEYVNQLAEGRYIIHLQGGGTGKNANFAAVWAQQDIPI